MISLLRSTSLSLLHTHTCLHLCDDFYVALRSFSQIHCADQHKSTPQHACPHNDFTCTSALSMFGEPRAPPVDLIWIFSWYESDIPTPIGGIDRPLVSHLPGILENVFALKCPWWETSPSSLQFSLGDGSQLGWSSPCSWGTGLKSADWLMPTFNVSALRFTRYLLSQSTKPFRFIYRFRANLIRWRSRWSTLYRLFSSSDAGWPVRALVRPKQMLLFKLDFWH